jgi:choline dehydrogenase-like flavoprotein
MPRVHVDWRMCDTDVESICKAYRLLRETLRPTGSCDVEFDEGRLREQVSRAIPVGGHHMGATRMAAAPSAGVVDPNCAVFGLPNLFVASASVFPTSGHANPTLTIVALAIRLAGHLKANFGDSAAC